MKELLILGTIEVSLLFQWLMISPLFGMEKEAILTPMPSNQFLASIPSSLLANGYFKKIYDELSQELKGEHK